VKQPWTDDLSEHSRAEILRNDSENRAWNKALRVRVAALVKRRLAKEISLDEYAISRQLENKNAAECKRRGAILFSEMNRRNRPLSDRTSTDREPVRGARLNRPHTEEQQEHEEHQTGSGG
jgi:hypothetical protein